MDGMNEVTRRKYLDWLETYRGNTELIKIIRGVRRCGKSTLLRQFAKKLVETGVSEDRIIRINLEAPELMHINNYQELSETIRSKMVDNGRYYLFLDEIQRVKGWEEVINSLLKDTDADIYITGSNSSILSTELTRILTGHYVSIRMLPLSFAEYTELRGDNRSSSEVLSEYMKYGGFPVMDPSADYDAANVLLQDIYSSIAFWDISSKGKIRSTSELNRIVSFVMENIGDPMQISNIMRHMDGISRNVIDNYLDAMSDSFLIHRVDRYDFRTATPSQTPKFYSVDPGMRTMSVGFSGKDTGRILRNIVYIELLRRGYNVLAGKIGSKEIDFIADKKGEREYFHVCLGFFDDETENKELAPLRAIEDNFPKTLILLNGESKSVTKDGIYELNVTDWLLDNQ